MNLFSRWKKRDGKVHTHNSNTNHKSVLIGSKHGLFDDIVGFEDVKALFKMAIRAERPVHLLLCGPPSSGKSLFMSSLTRLQRSYYAVGSSSTKSGIFDYLFEHRPRYFVVDELEKMNKKDQTSLLNLMESGILSELNSPYFHVLYILKETKYIINTSLYCHHLYDNFPWRVTAACAHVQQFQGLLKNLSRNALVISLMSIIVNFSGA